MRGSDFAFGVTLNSCGSQIRRKPHPPRRPFVLQACTTRGSVKRKKTQAQNKTKKRYSPGRYQVTKHGIFRVQLINRAIPFRLHRQKVQNHGKIGFILSARPRISDNAYHCKIKPPIPAAHVPISFPRGPQGPSEPLLIGHPLISSYRDSPIKYQVTDFSESSRRSSTSF